MSTVTLERNGRIITASPVSLVTDDREVAWAEGLIRPNPLYAWILGRFVGAETANANGHMFRTTELRTAAATLVHAPLNYLHRPRQVLGTYVGAELVYPTEPAVAAAAAHPFVESLAAMWRYYFQEEYASLKVFHEAGQLAQSMECVPSTLTCATEGCGKEFAYAGRASETYCDHLNGSCPPRWLNRPRFSGGAIVVPPAVPAWRGARVSQVLAAKAEQLRTAEAEGLAGELYRQVAEALPNLAETDRETVMALLMARSGPAVDSGARKLKRKLNDAPPGYGSAGDQPHAHDDVDPEDPDSPCKICGRSADSPIHQGLRNGADVASVEDGTAAMIALYPPRSLAAKMSMDARFADGLAPAELHITLAYLGPDAVVTMDRAAVEAILGPLAAASKPLIGSVSGVGRFSAGYPAGQEAWPLYASIDVPDLPEFRQRLVAALAAAGIPYARNHGFTPHMTLAYVGPDDEPAAGRVLAAGVEPTPLAFAEVVLAWGNDRIPFTLGEKAAPAAAQETVDDIVARGQREAAAVPVFDLALGRSISAAQRQEFVKKGWALPDGSFPIETVADLGNAIKLAGNSKNPAAAKAHIRKRARALGASDRVPKDW